MPQENLPAHLLVWNELVLCGAAINRIILALSLIMIILVSIVVAAGILLDFEEDKDEEVKSYTFLFQWETKPMLYPLEATILDRNLTTLKY